ncbi:MAG: alcohol dehydrogenase catalytic domain-containing protein [Gammaproteobacteria bacterium]|nr:alcohol dehydrogenase catalytic domain-containing protein [Gammaproteobacteria bacterium]
MYLQNHKLALRFDQALPAIGHDEVLLKVKLAGICGTDLALINGYANFNGVPGHEFVAEVVEIGAGIDGGLTGRRVVAEINQWCGECDQCAQKHYTHCLSRRVIGIRDHQGCFAEQIIVKASTLHVIPDSLDDRQAIFIEPLAAAFRIVEQLHAHDYHDVMLIGAGRLGQLIARVMVLQKKTLTVVVRHSQQCKLLQGLPLNCIDESAVEARTVDVTIDATGQQSGLTLALHALRSQGICVMKSSYPSPFVVDLTRLVIDEIKLLGSRCGPFSIAIKALEDGSIETESLIDATFVIDDYQAAFALADQKGSMKVLIKPC